MRSTLLTSWSRHPKYETPQAFFNYWLEKNYILYGVMALLGALASLSYGIIESSYDFYGLRSSTNAFYLSLSLSGFAFFLFKSTTLRHTLVRTFIYFFFYYLFTLYWVGHAFGVVGLGWFAIIPYIGLPLVSSLLPTFLCLVAWYSAQKSSNLIKTLALGACLSTAFLLTFFTQFGFPWILPGYTLPLHLLQTASYIGIEGLTWLTTFGALFFFSRSPLFTGTFIAILGAMSLWGMLRLNHESTITPYNFRLIQPSISQKTKWDPEHIQQNLQIQGDLSQLDAEKPIQAIIWPEAAVAFPLEKYPEIQKMLGHASPQGGYLFLGTVRESEKGPHNSFIVLDEKGEEKAIYDKKHLVPYGEYVPFRFLLPGVEKLTHGARDFIAGSKSSVINLPKIPPFRILICYEAIFSREILTKDQRPDWLLNITNDAWYGHSAGPYQHLANVRVRAIEQGLPLVRTANNGISAVIDPYGRILYRLDLDDVGIIDFALPEKLPSTFYAQHGAPIIYILLIMNTILIGTLLIRRWSQKSK